MRATTSGSRSGRSGAIGIGSPSDPLNSSDGRGGPALRKTRQASPARSRSLRGARRRSTPPRSMHLTLLR
jgi:hypothetical protein